jgi:hypothetical protein
MSVLVSDHCGHVAATEDTGRSWTALKAQAVPLIICAALWAICHPYPGIVGDAHIYIGRVLADLDPSGVGRDMMFVHDGQFQFSLFPPVTRGLVARLGPGLAAEAISAAGCLCWFAAALALAMQLTKGRAVWLTLAFVCVLPHAYGHNLFVSAEALAVPRPFAEAAVLACLASLLAGRLLLAIGFALFGFAIHPIMALPGFAVIGAIYLRDWRFISAVSLIFAVCIGFGLAGVPLFDRLFVQIDQEWLRELNPYLFPTRWTSADYAPLVVQTVTIAIAAKLLSGTPRYVFAASLIAGLGGVLVSALFGDLLRNLLAIQVQGWRSAWLLAVMGEYAFALCVIRLWSSDAASGKGGLTLALLAFGWFCNPDLIVAIVIAATALVLHFGGFAKPIAPRYVVAICTAVAFLIVWSYAAALADFLRLLEHMPSAAAMGLVYGMRINIAALPICALAFVWFTWTPERLFPPGFDLTAGLALALAGAALWSFRSDAVKDFESLRNPAEFAPLLADRPGEVLWIGGKSEAWQVLRRAQWASVQQGVSILFSRPLAILWRDRVQVLLDNGLIQDNVLTPGKEPEHSGILNVTRAALDRLCSRDDAPVAVIFPLEKGKPLPAGVAGPIWTLPHSRFLPEMNGSYIWHEADRYAAFACAESPHAGNRAGEGNPPALRGGLL